VGGNEPQSPPSRLQVGRAWLRWGLGTTVFWLGLFLVLTWLLLLFL
jgi:hypothetical protein